MELLGAKFTGSWGLPPIYIKPEKKKHVIELFIFFIIFDFGLLICPYFFPLVQFVFMSFSKKKIL